MSNRAYNLLADDEVVFFGQPVVAVLADDPATAEEAADLVAIDYEPLPVVLDPIDAMREDAPLARAGGDPRGDRRQPLPLHRLHPHRRRHRRRGGRRRLADRPQSAATTRALTASLSLPVY
jgi:CO/xanthine dehydrogenase Mo-binding subunit